MNQTDDTIAIFILHRGTRPVPSIVLIMKKMKKMRPKTHTGKKRLAYEMRRKQQDTSHTHTNRHRVQKNKK